MKRNIYMNKKEPQTKIICGKWLLFIAMLLTVSFVQAQSYKICSDNYVVNSKFTGGTDNSPSVANWTFSPAGDSDLGWKQDNTLLYGENLFIDRLGTYAATPTLTTTPCANMPKVVKFYYNAGNTGRFTFEVKLGSETIATFNEWGTGAGSVITTGAGVTSSIIDRRFVSEGPITGNQLWNNIWHEVTLYVPGYTSGDLSFEYTRTLGVSRQIRLDNVELRELMPTPVPTQTTVETTSCDATTYDLTSLNPADPNYTYAWYNDANHTSPVATPTAAPIGTYYLFATSTCAQSCVSNASTAVTVKKPDGCCGSKNEVSNPSFTDDTNGDGKAWDGWNFPNSITGFDIVNSTTIRNTSRLSFAGRSSVLHFYQAVNDYRIQQTVKTCPGGAVRIAFDFAAVEYTTAGIDQAMDVNLDGTTYLNIYIEDTGFTDDDKIWFAGIPSTGVTVKVKNLTTNEEIIAQNGTSDLNFIQPGQKDFYRITIDIANYAGAENSLLDFFFRRYMDWFIDNVTIKNFEPIAEDPTSVNVNTTCPSGTFNLTTTQPTTYSNHQYTWYADAAGTTLVSDPTKVKAGTYYMKTISTCSGCEATTLKPIIVTQACPTVAGTLYNNYDGGNFSGNTGTSGGGLFASLVDAGGTVISTVGISNDGSYSLIGTIGSNLKVIITTDSIPTGGSLSSSTLNPNYVYAGEEFNSTFVAGGDGISNTFTLTTSQNLTGVNFGVQFPPIASDIIADVATSGAGNPYTIDKLYSVDDDPSWSDGVGQKVIIKTVSSTNGTLTYNGTPVTPGMEIPNYDPSLLVFTPLTDDEATLDFTYVYEDAAGAQSPVDGVVKYRFLHDADGDNVPDLYDQDDDNDGVLDTEETPDGVDPLADADGDGTPNYEDPDYPGFVDTNGDGINDNFDTDKDGIIDSQDTDADGDGIADIVENGGTDSDGDGMLDSTTDTDGDGLADVVDPDNGGTPLTPLDKDEDSVVNAKDTDSDGDGIPDAIEKGCTPTAPAIYCTPVDTDNDGIPDYLDLDSDNDGINDVIEAGLTDSDGDGLSDGGATNDTPGTDYVTPLGGTSATGSDTDGDGILDQFDGKDGFGDAVLFEAIADEVSIGQGETSTISVLNNDTDGNGNQAAVIGTNSGQVALSEVSSDNAGITLDTATGNINVASDVPVGTYDLEYQICEQTALTNCKTATVSITVTTATGVPSPTTLPATLKIYSDGNKHIVVHNTSDEAFNVHVFDLGSRQLAQQNVNVGELVRIAMEVQGVYIVRATNAKTVKTERVLIK